MQPLVSVIIPVYNHAAYVEEALLSVFEQTYPHLEVIIIDDGSKDASVNVIEAFLSKHALPSGKVIFHKQSNTGAHATINRGLCEAKGDYLTILNSDDFYHVRRIERLLAEMQRVKSQIGFSRVHVVDETGKSAPRGNWWWSWYERCMIQFAHVATVGFKLMQDNIAVSTGNLIFSRQLYEEVGSFSNLKLAHDYDFVMRALSVSEPVFAPEDLYFYRLHSDNTAPKVLHLVQEELGKIYKSFLLSAYRPCKNILAPNPTAWPVSFSRHRKNSSYDRFFLPYIKSKGELPAPLEKIESETEEAITLVTFELASEGVEDAVFALRKAGKKVNIFSLHEGPKKEFFEKLGVSVSILPPRFCFWLEGPAKWKRGLNLLSTLACFFIQTKRKIFFYGGQIWPMALTAPIVFPWKKFSWYVNEAYGPETVIAGGFGMKLFRRSVKNQLFSFSFGSQEAKKAWFPANGNVTYLHPINSHKPQNKKAKIKKLLAIGTESFSSGFHFLVEAFVTLVKEKRLADDVELSLVGFSKTLSDMERYYSDMIMKIIDAGLENRVQFYEQSENAEPFFEDADLYIHCRTTHDLPRSLFQAMGRGLPIISSCATEIIENDVNGYVYPEKNSKILAQVLLKAIQNPEKSYQLGAVAQEQLHKQYASNSPIK